MAALTASAFPGLELLGTAVVALDADHVVRYANPAAEDLLGAGARTLVGQSFLPLFSEDAALRATLEDALKAHWTYRAQTVHYVRPGKPSVPLSCVVTPIDVEGTPLLAELRPIQEQLRLEREERLLDQQEATRELIRNLAHEIKNPLGGLRGSAGPPGPAPHPAAHRPAGAGEHPRGARARSQPRAGRVPEGDLRGAQL
jgi:two-component system nitrogen regulation sensor histidine kinase GlnL